MMSTRLISVAVASIGAVLVAAQAQAGSDCCVPNGTPGCDTPGCEASICSLDPFCCNIQWDQICANQAVKICAVCGGIIDCCYPNGTPGCEIPSCQDCVCDLDPFCCDNSWDNICAGEAEGVCQDQCPCQAGPTCGSPGCPTDLNGDGTTNAADLAILLGAWGPNSSCADLNFNGLVNAADLAILLGGWGCSLCGNGVVDPGEECDDGNNDDGDGCESNCLFGVICIELTAEVAFVRDSANLLGGAIFVGQIITGTYIYDPTTVDSNSAPTVGDYWHSVPPFGLTVVAGGLVFQTDPDDVLFLVEIVNDHFDPPRDVYILRSYNNLPLFDFPNVSVEHISWQLNDRTATAHDSEALPTAPPVLTDWQSILGLILVGCDADPSECPGRNDYYVMAHVTSVQYCEN